VEKAVLILLPIVAFLVVIAALMNRLPQNAAVIVPALALSAMVFIAYRTSFRGPKVRLEPMPVNGFKHYLSSGYSNGMPSTWSINVRLLGTNDSPRTGYLTSFVVDTLTLGHTPRKPVAFDIGFSELQYQATVSTTLPVSLPVTFQARASHDLLFRAALTFTSGPDDLAADLREVSSFTVTYRYRAGKLGNSTERKGSVTVNYGQLRDGVRSYWSGAPQYAQWVRRLDESGET
jgi:hypothetical protein